MKLKFALLLTISTIILLASCAGPAKTTTASQNGDQATDQTSTSSQAVSDDEVVQIKDAELEKIIREKIGKPEGDILVSDMAMVYSININNEETPVSVLDGLEYAVNLSDFSYRYGQLVSLDPVSGMQQLTYMNISYSTVDQAPKQFNTPLLARISFIETNVSDFAFLENATAMTSVNFTRCGATSIEFLANANSLEEVNLSDNQIVDISPLAGKTAMVSLTLHQNEVTDISALSSCTSLEMLNISYNHVTNLKPIMDLPNLMQLRAYEELDQKIIDRNQIQTLIDSGVQVDFHG